MRKLLVVMVVLLAVIMPLSVQGAVETYELVPVLLAEADCDHMSVSGTASGWFRTNLAATLRQATSDTGLVKFAVSGRQFQTITASQDRINRSGRYRTSSQKLVPEGAMIAPTVRFEVTATGEVTTRDAGAPITAVISLFGGKRSSAPRIRDMVSEAQVRIVFEQYGISDGISSGHSYTATGTAKEHTDSRISGGKFNRMSGCNFGRRSPRDVLIADATEDAIRDLVRQIVSDYRPEPICSVDITSGKSIWQIGTVISFYRNDKLIAKYEILGIEGRTLAVRILKQDRLPKAGDPFKISQ